MVTFELGYFYKNISCMLKVSYLINMLQEFYNEEKNKDLEHNINSINTFSMQCRTYKVWANEQIQ